MFTKLTRILNVSVFLRRLEYYGGILFLTTNRYDCIDSAFKSRIDLVLPFNDLNHATRLSIWTQFLHAIAEQERHFTDEEIEKLARRQLNGREIRNIVKTGRLLARSKKEKLEFRHLDTLLDIRKRVARLDRRTIEDEI